jgi:LasA protease
VLIIPIAEQITEDVKNSQDDIIQFIETEVISDHNLVYGPTAKNFDVAQFLQAYKGYLLDYEEEVESQLLNGSEIVQLVADRHSVNPRLLLAILEYNAGWLTEKEPKNIEYMIGREEEGREGLYRQLSWAANMLNFGFYGRSEGGLSDFLIGETEVRFAPGVSDGTAAVQYYLAARDNLTYQEWQFDAGPDGLAATYRQLFGDPLSDSESPLIPNNLQQPALLLPWERGTTWYFSGGPHGGWNSGSAWAALDFAPPDVEYGCFTSESWVTAVADGIIARSGFGAVVLDLDNDGYAGSGWAITYMHLDNRDRLEEGTKVFAGDRIGHPGCEGGVTNGTHLHIARTYNGRWISADRIIPFELGGWVSGGQGYEYNGWLKREGVTKTADVYRTEDNAITAD